MRHAVLGLEWSRIHATMDGDLLPFQPITRPHLRRVARFDISVPDLEFHLVLHLATYLTI